MTRVITLANERRAMGKAPAKLQKAKQVSDIRSAGNHAHLLNMMAEVKRCGIDPGIPIEELLKAQKKRLASTKKPNLYK